MEISINASKRFSFEQGSIVVLQIACTAGVFITGWMDVFKSTIISTSL